MTHKKIESCQGCSNLISRDLMLYCKITGQRWDYHRVNRFMDNCHLRGKWFYDCRRCHSLTRPTEYKKKRYCLMEPRKDLGDFFVEIRDCPEEKLELRECKEEFYFKIDEDETGGKE